MRKQFTQFPTSYIRASGNGQIRLVGNQVIDDIRIIIEAVDNSVSRDLLKKFINLVFPVVNGALPSDRKDYGFYLRIYTWGPYHEGSPAHLCAEVGSTEVKGTDVYRGGSEVLPYTEIPVDKELYNDPDTVILETMEGVRRLRPFAEWITYWVAQIPKIYQEYTRRFNSLQQIPEDILDAACKLNYWITREKLGADPRKNPDGLDRREYLKYRTYDNRRGGYYQRNEILDYIDLLCDYADDNNMSDADLIKLAEDAIYVKRRKSEFHV